VLHPEDAAGGKVGTLARRGQVRDYADTAALLARWTPAELAGFARRLDPALAPRHLAEIARRLDRLPDHAFGPYGLDIPGPNQRAAQVRERFATWPRDPRALNRGQDRTARTPARQRRAPHNAPATTRRTVAGDRPGRDDSAKLTRARHRPPDAQPTRR
jgi:hypothetical protein